MATMLKPGHKTTEFWSVVLANVLANTGTIDVGGDKQRGLLLILSVVAYALSRGFAKVAAPKDEAVSLTPVALAGNVGEGDAPATP